jgi:transcriptional regulator with XRE-family HTH domain
VITLKPETLRTLKYKLHKKYGSSAATARAFKLNKYTVTDSLKGRHRISLKMLLKFLDDLNIEIEWIEKNILDIGTNGFKIFNPKFPIVPNPVFASILLNLIGDGCIIGNCTGFFHYKDGESHKIIAEKVLRCIGNTTNKTIGIYIPSLLVHLVRKYFDITFPCKRLPEKILNANSMVKLACLTAFINDEGSVTPRFIMMYSKNKELLKDIRNICITLNYKVSGIRTNKKGISNFEINSVKKFYTDYKKLKQEYPECRLLTRKEEILNLVDLDYIDGRELKKEKISETILSALSTEPKNIYELVRLTKIRIGTLHQHLRELILNNLVIREKVGHNYFYKLNM